MRPDYQNLVRMILHHQYTLKEDMSNNAQGQQSSTCPPNTNKGHEDIQRQKKIKMLTDDEQPI